MYQQFQHLRDPDKQLELRAFVQDSNVEELTKIIHNSVCKTDAPKIFDDILQAFPDSEVCRSKRLKLTENTLKILEKTKIPTIHADAIVNRIILDLPKHSKPNIVKLVDFCVIGIRDDNNKNNEFLCSWKDLLPALLEALENEKHVVNADTEVSGNEYKSLIVKAISNYQWNTNHLPLLAKMFGEMALDKQDRRIVVRALCRALPDLSPNQVPPFVYQSLKLCKDNNKRYFFDALCKYFKSLYAKATSTDDKDSMESIGIVGVKELADIESTVLYYVYQAVQLDHESLKDFLRHLKCACYVSKYILQPFMLAMLTSVSSIYTDQIFEILKLAIVNGSQDKEKRQRSAWLRQLLSSDPDVIDIVRRIVDARNKDCRMLLKGLVELAFVLMSTSQKFKHNAAVLWDTGAEIIREIIKRRHETVATVLQQLIDKIVAGGTPMIRYTDCLKYACRELSVIILDHQIWIMTLLERLLFLPTVVADQVLFAILPLMHVSPNIRENLLLTLRKALYRKGIAKRQMAVTGFLEMLKYSKMHSLSNFRLSQRCNSSMYAVSSSSTSTLTQVTVEYGTQREKSTSEPDKTLCYEILDILKKSFTYEFEVRLHLYKGFYGTAARNHEIAEVVLNMLVSHLNLYLENDDNVLPPIKFELCIDVQGTEMVLKEPIAELIFAIQKIYIGMLTKKSNTSDKWRNILESLCTRMAATDSEHFNLGTDLSEDSLKSQIKLQNLNTAIVIYEALIAFRIGQWFLKGNSEICDSIENLFKGYMRSIDLVKTKQSIKAKKPDGGKAKKNKDTSHATRTPIKSNNVKLPATIMDLDAIHQCIALLYSNKLSSSAQTQLVQLRGNHSFCCYVLQTCEHLLQTTKSLMSDAVRTQSNSYADVYIGIGGLLYEYFFLSPINVAEHDEQITVLALQCFNEICYCMCTTFSSELPRFLNTILQSKSNFASEDINFQLQEVILSLNDYFIESVSQETDSNIKKKVPILLLQIMEQFAYKINFARFNGEKVFECVKKVVQTKELEASIVPIIVQFLLRLEEYTQEYGETLNEICLKLCEKVGTIDGNQPTSNEKYEVIREETFEPIYNVLNDCIKEKLNNASWLLLHLKAEDIIVRESGTIDEIYSNSLREKERNLCKQLSHLTQVLHTLANTSIEPGPCTDITFKNLQYLYHLLGNLTKYFYAKSNGQDAAFQAVKFIQVIQLAGKPLKSAFYNLVTYLEENQNKLDSKADSQARRNKILRETKVIPRVVYEIEQFNKEVLLLGKRTGIPLENYMKHSITRDFRIKNPQLVEGLEKLDASLLSLSNSEDTDSEIRNSDIDKTTSSTADIDKTTSSTADIDKTTSSTADDATPSKKRSRTED